MIETQAEPSPVSKSGLTRRGLLEGTGASATALAVPGVGSNVHAAVGGRAVQPSAVSASGPGQRLDIWFGFVSPGLDGVSGRAPVHVLVGNAGPGDATAPVDVHLVSPFYAKFDTSTLPARFAEHLVRHEAPHVPDVIRCEVPAAELLAGRHVRFTVHLEPMPDGPRLLGQVTGFAMPRGDTELTLLNNEALGTVAVPIRPVRAVPDGANAVGYYFTYLQPVVKTGATTPLRVYVGNRGPNSPTSDAVFTFVTPFHVKVDRDDVAFRMLKPTYHHGVMDPHVPDVVSFAVSKRLLPADPGLLTDLTGLDHITIPLRGHPGGHSNRGGKGMLATGGRVDFDPDPATAIDAVSVVHPA